MNLESALRYSHTLLDQVVRVGDTVIDATVGNGNDTVYLAASVGKAGHVYGFDIQAAGLEKTKTQLLLTGLLPQTTLIQDGHEHIDNHVPADTEISAAIFNLGYLPGSDKTVVTHGETTIAAINQCLKMLQAGGLVVVVSYYGHPGGKQELTTLQSFLRELPQKKFQVLTYQFINQKNDPPILFAIQKR
ncbi:SAM-dependent methyltransferase, MraW methylase family [Pediococcus damnosus]|uniref:SAM-dependent methyltransferase, MraW methylase family n=1 Tax=Pediococcus damnosus TaxID=51663 RepID=A0A0R2HLJ1_9LACO|nr:class I SAM-dependent methyltransferase [Pediococcus damnosus]AMV61301.1 SAM-dependent methyltransferase, MraW methylase family [Pediococcus damnosus]AMV62344.1 SAM-dependent methyltransferase, MraW methylase family [Pediococcus damnosus]AMV65661.1 SAM-dependent methyltransferase, MraW methylase family [Pediococcus damnosus]AMV67796.1 SAM-dependent methyltransferase, MraW methylase family [Pediococcus damnosus]AMV70003.1 SAM-dependent methyltransferase, MraW methylase family [Pediococcus da